MMDWRMVSAMVAVITLAGSLFNYFLSLRLRADMAELRETIATRADGDRRQIEQWADDRFIRADLMEAKLDSMNARLRVIEMQLERQHHEHEAVN